MVRDLRLRDVLAMAGLASASGLRRRRLRPGDGCAPVGRFRGVPLWQVSDAVPVEVSPGVAARMDAARTCAVCGVRSDVPWPLGPDRSTRFCPDHAGFAWSRRWSDDHGKAMDACRRWAAGLVADPSTVVVVFDVEPGGGPGRLVVVALRGAVLVDEAVSLLQVGGRYQLGRVEGGSALVDVEWVDRMASVLVGRTLVSPCWWQVGRLLSFVRDSGRFAISTRVHKADEWVGRWLGLQPATGCQGVTFDEAVRPYPFDGDLLDQALSVVSWMSLMAVDILGDDFDTLGDSDA